MHQLVLLAIVTTSITYGLSTASPDSDALTCDFKNYSWCQFTPGGGWQIYYDSTYGLYSAGTNLGKPGGSIASILLNNTSPVCFMFSYLLSPWLPCPAHDAPVTLTIELDKKVLFNVSSKPDQGGWTDASVTITPGQTQTLRIIVVKNIVAFDAVGMMDFEATDGAC